MTAIAQDRVKPRSVLPFLRLHSTALFPTLGKATVLLAVRPLCLAGLFLFVGACTPPSTPSTDTPPPKAEARAPAATVARDNAGQPREQSVGSPTQPASAGADDTAPPASSAQGPAAADSPAQDAASTVASNEAEDSLTPVLIDADGQPFAQTKERPAEDAPWLEHSARQLFLAIVKDDPELALPFFFPEVAYRQVKDIPNPDADWKTRLLSAYNRDIHAYHQQLGAHREEAEFVELKVAHGLARWVEPGKEVNKVGYYRVMRSVLVYRDHQERRRELGVLTMISWRGQWYVVHLRPFK